MHVLRGALLFILLCPFHLGLVTQPPRLGLAHRRVRCRGPPCDVRAAALPHDGPGPSDAARFAELEEALAEKQRRITQLEAELRLWQDIRDPRPGASKPMEPAWWDPTYVQAFLGARPIGRVATSFPEKNGTPRQGAIVPASKARLALEFGNNPQHAVDGLSEFSHVWLLFLFHDNGPPTPPRAKVRPPRLGGATKGVFATRAPHRPNPIGLSLCRLDRVEGHVLELSGVDLVTYTHTHMHIHTHIRVFDRVVGHVLELSGVDLVDALSDVKYTSMCM